MASLYRYDGWMRNTLGQAIAGAEIYVCTQPSVTSFLPPSPLASIFYDSAGADPVTQPVYSDGFGHYYFYALAGLYTIVVSNGGEIQLVLPDQSLGSVGSSGAPQITLETNGAVNGSQSLLNLVGGGNTTITNDGLGNTTVTVSGFGSGTVTSFSAGAFDSVATTSVANPTTTPALSFSLNPQNANYVWAGPTSGGSANPTFRLLVAADLPSIGVPFSNVSAGTNTNALIVGSGGTFTPSGTGIIGASGLEFGTAAFAPTPRATTSFSITSSTGTGTQVTLICNNNFISGQLVTLSGLAFVTNGQYAVLSTSLSATQFVINFSATYGARGETGTAILNVYPSGEVPTTWTLGGSGNWNPQAGVDNSTTLYSIVWSAGQTVQQNSYIVDTNGYYQNALSSSGVTGASQPVWSTVLGATTTDNTVTWQNAGYAGDSGTLTWYRRMYFRDTGAPTQSGKNAFLSVNHLSGVGTTKAIQDRAIWVSMQNAATDTADDYIYGMEGIQVELDFLGQPTFYNAADGEVSAISVQMSDQHTGAIAAPNYGCNGMRVQYYREAGSGSWGSIGPCAGKFIATNDSTVNAGFALTAVQVQTTDASGGPNNITGIGVSILAPGTRLTNNTGLEIGNFGTVNTDYAIQSQGGQVFFAGPTGVGSLFNTTGGSPLVVACGLTAQGLGSTQCTAPGPPYSVTAVGTTGSTTYSYVYVGLDANGNGVSSATSTITNGNAVLSSVNYNSMELSGSTEPLGYSAIAVYRTVGGATQGRIGLFTLAVGNYQRFYNGVFNDTGQTADGTTPPVANVTGSIISSGALGVSLVSTAAITTAANLGSGLQSAAVPVKADTSNANQFVVTTTSDTGAGVVIGVLSNTPAAGALGNIVTSGVVPMVLGTGTAAIGNFVIVDTTTTGRVKCTGTYTAGTVIGVAMSAQSSVGSTFNVMVNLR